MTWQPIETAPKDGTEILVCGSMGRSTHAVAFWHEDDSEIWVDDGGGFWATDYRQKGNYTIVDAEFWMPLPEPPQDDGMRRSSNTLVKIALAYHTLFAEWRNLPHDDPMRDEVTGTINAFSAIGFGDIFWEAYWAFGLTQHTMPLKDALKLIRKEIKRKVTE